MSPYGKSIRGVRHVHHTNERDQSRTKASEQLLSSDTHSNTANYKFTYSVEIAPICKDDLVCLPTKLARQLGNIAPLVVCTRVGNSIHLMDPATLQTAELTAAVFWRTPFESLAGVTELVEFTVLDVEPSGPKRSKWVLADSQVALNNAFRSGAGGADDDALMLDDTGAAAGGADGILHTRTHLGALLQPGDTALGFHLTHANFNSDAFAALPPGRVPDVVLVKKTYPNRRKKNRSRNWRLRSMAMEAEPDDGTANGRGVVGRMGGRDKKKVNEDYELFLRELEEDPEMRGAVNLFKAKDDREGAGSGTAGGKTRKRAQFAMEVDEGRPPGAAPATGEETEDGDEAEADFPDVKLDELLDDFDEMTLGDNRE